MKKHTKSARVIKEETIATLAEKIAKSKTITFADYHGLDANQVAELRSKIKAVGGEFIVTKNTLMQKALKVKGLEVELKELEGPTATIFAYEDEVSPLKQISESQKTTELPKYKFGFMGIELLNPTALDSLAKLPSKDALQAKVVGALVSPIYGIVGVLAANLRNLVYALDQIKTQKEGTR